MGWKKGVDIYYHMGGNHHATSRAVSFVNLDVATKAAMNRLSQSNQITQVQMHYWVFHFLISMALVTPKF